jgi:hypothetical protein
MFQTVATAANGDTVVWTPEAGKRVSVTSVSIMVTANASIVGGGVLTVTIREKEGANPSVPLGIGLSVFCPAVAGTLFGSGFYSGWIVLAEELPVSLPDNVVTVFLSAALATGTCRVILHGQEVG